MSEPTPEMIDAGFAKAAQFTTVVDRQELAAIYTVMRALERPSDEAVERVARALYECDGGSAADFDAETTTTRPAYYALARAAIAAMQEQSK